MPSATLHVSPAPVIVPGSAMGSEGSTVDFVGSALGLRV
jgi:hypothetical protein